MAIRTTPQKVEATLGSNYDRVTSLIPSIEAASLLINKVVTCMSTRGLVAHDSETLEMLERYIAAHLYTFHDKVLQSESKGKASGSYQGQTGMGLQSTDYGQFALTLDTSGCLMSIDLGKNPSAKLLWLGKPKSSQIDYSARD